MHVNLKNILIFFHVYRLNVGEEIVSISQINEIVFRKLQ